MKRTFLLVVAIGPCMLATVLAAEPAVPHEAAKLPDDIRLGKPRDLNAGYFPLNVPPNRAVWDTRSREVREQVLVANGLWPTPEKIALQPVIHGKIERDGYTVEKVFFASYPGHYVSGNLYRPKGRAGKLAGVLCPHGHWANGRFFEAGEGEVKKQMAQGAEQTAAGARYPLQARCAQLARMGCVVFHYDMVGNADSQQIQHTRGFTDAAAELRLQNFMGLQTFNSIRALDFLLSLPDVYPKRIGVTGASGGGTQTFILCAIDERPTVAFPAVMVSTAMQGGCICENCSYLRLGTGNIELAGLFAPKPLAMSGANDWTIDIETKGLPELTRLYRLYKQSDLVMAKCFPQFGHNYNQVSREVMYNWFNRHLALGIPEPVVEKPFEPVPPKELSVYNSEHPRPSDAVDAERLRQYMTEASNKQMAALRPTNGARLKEFRRVLGTALRVMIGESSQKERIDAETTSTSELQTTVTTTWTTVTSAKKTSTTTTTGGTTKIERLLFSPRGSGESVPALLMSATKSSAAPLVIWVHPEGKGTLFQGHAIAPAAQRILDSETAILAPDVFMTGEFAAAKPPTVNANFAGYTFGYNRPLLANRVHDILTAVEFARQRGYRKIHLVGWEKAGPWVVLARALCGDVFGRTAADVNQFRFEQVKATNDPMMLPGALKYGGLSAFAALAAPGELFLHNASNSGAEEVVRVAYKTAAAPEKALVRDDKAPVDKVIDWLLR